MNIPKTFGQLKCQSCGRIFTESTAPENYKSIFSSNVCLECLLNRDFEYGLYMEQHIDGQELITKIITKDTEQEIVESLNFHTQRYSNHNLKYYYEPITKIKQKRTFFQKLVQYLINWRNHVRF